MADITIAYNSETRKCDVVFDGRDFALDATPASAMLFSILAERRAHPDDVLPINVPDWAQPEIFNAKRGCPGDALDPAGALTGSRMWLLDRRLFDDTVTPDAENYLAEAIQWLETIRSLALQIMVRRVNAPDGTPAQILGYRVRAGATALQLQQAFG